MLGIKIKSRFLNSNGFVSKQLINELFYYPTPGTINYAYSFGSSAGVFFFLQIISGLFLSMHYIADAQYAFDSVIYIMQAVKYGWFFRYAHMNGASFIFIFLFLHIARGIYFQSFNNNRFLIWLTGVTILFLMMAIAFIGYVLPWGQMSFWGATVITNLLTVAGQVGSKIVNWVWGGFCVGGVTLTRFYSLHFILPFVAFAVIVLHLGALHSAGSSRPNQTTDFIDWVKFFPYFFYKDLLITSWNFYVFTYFVGFIPNYLGHPDNWIEANSLMTPPHIVPEWYFTPFYAILRAFASKIIGVCGMTAAIAVLLSLPIFDFVGECGHASAFNSPTYKIFFWIFCFSFLMLTYLGGKPAVDPYVWVSLIVAGVYFNSFTTSNVCRKIKLILEKFWYFVI